VTVTDLIPLYVPHRWQIRDELNLKSLSKKTARTVPRHGKCVRPVAYPSQAV
jgi:hypothetical protein